MAAPIFVIGLVARKAIQFASKKAAEAFLKKNSKKANVKIVQGLKNIGNRVRTTVKQIRAENRKLEDPVTKDEAIMSGVIIGAYPVHKMQQKKENKEKKKRLGLIRGKK